MPSALRNPGPIPFLLISWGLWLGALLWGEQVPAGDGLGWDGVRFARYATAGPQALLEREINAYYVQRVGPSLLVHGVIRSLGLPFNPVTIRWTFLGMNLVLLSLAILMLVDVGRRLALSDRAQWLLFLGLFANAANGRMPVYYANIGDAVAFTLGMAMVWGWVRGYVVVLAATSLIALVSWPAAFYLLLPLVLLPRAAFARRDEDPTKPAASMVRGWTLLFLPVGSLLLAASWSLSSMPPVTNWAAWTTASLATNAWLLGAAAVAALATIDRRLLQDAAAVVSPRTLILGVGLLLCGRAYVAATQSGSLAFNEGTYWREVLLYARTRPLAPLAGHAAYFGALAAVACGIWPRALRAARALGPGPFIALALMGLQAMDTESRRLNANWPLVGLCVVLALQPWLSDGRIVAALTAAFLLLSKLWWRWTGPSLFAVAHEPGNYYNLQGPSLSDEAYLAHLVAAAALATVAWLLVRREAAPEGGGLS